MFLSYFKSNVISVAIQKWKEELYLNKTIRYYRTFKEYLMPEPYLLHVQNKCQIILFAKLRCSDHQLQIEKGRHREIERHERYCEYCKKHNSFCVEDKFHFI